MPFKTSFSFFSYVQYFADDLIARENLLTITIGLMRLIIQKTALSFYLSGLFVRA